MSLMTRILNRMFKLPPAETHRTAVEADLAIPMADGIVLKADRYYPCDPGTRPLMLVRTAYGRKPAGSIYTGNCLQNTVSRCSL